MTEAPRLDRRDAVRRLLTGRRDTLVITGLGAPTYDTAAASDDARNFYLWGAMGGAAMMGFGLALAQPSTPVLVITGDGEMLMGMGALATIATRNPGNLAIVVLDNGRYGETGGQESHTAHRTDLRAVAAACGIGDTQALSRIEEVDALAPMLHRLGNTTLFATLAIERGERERLLPPRDGVFLKNRMRGALGLAPI